MSRTASTSLALLLRSTSYGDADRILTLFTRESGKISVLARRAARSVKRFGGALESFSLIEATVVSSSRRLWTLSEARLVRAHMGLAQSLRRIGAASFLLELTREILAEHQPEPDLFDLVEESLSLLEHTEDEEIVKLTMASELKILTLSGSAIAADRCNACGRPVPAGKRVRFHPQRGGVVCTACGGGPIILSSGAREALVALAQVPLDQAAKVQLTPGHAQELKSAVERFLEHHLGRSLKMNFFLN